jgi:hypothetical protein
MFTSGVEELDIDSKTCLQVLTPILTWGVIFSKKVRMLVVTVMLLFIINVVLDMQWFFYFLK